MQERQFLVGNIIASNDANRAQVKLSHDQVLEIYEVEKHVDEMVTIIKIGQMSLIHSSRNIYSAHDYENLYNVPNHNDKNPFEMAKPQLSDQTKVVDTSWRVLKTFAMKTNYMASGRFKSYSKKD